MRKRGMAFFIGLFVLSMFLFIPGEIYSIYFGQGKIKPAQQEFAPGRLIAKLKPEVDKKVILDQAQGIATTGLGEFDKLNARTKGQTEIKLIE